MSVIVDGSNGLIFNDASTQTTAATGFGFKNRIINGAMVIDQRNAGASVTATAVGGVNYVLDRFGYSASQASKFTVQQNAGSVTPPAGFAYYLGVTSSSAYSVVSGDYFGIRQRIEGLNVADLAWGTASASSVTLSFWVRSSLTGTFGGSLANSAENRSYPFTYTISSANTWEQKSVAIAGDTSGTWLTTSGIGIQLNLSLGTGSTYSGTAGAWAGSTLLSATGATSVVGTSGATFYITGVQLEKGSTATAFDYRDYGRELMMCQRYYQTSQFFTGIMNSSSSVIGMINWSVWMRSSPTISTSGNIEVTDGYTADYSQSSGGISTNYQVNNSTGAMVSMVGFSGMAGSYRFCFTRQSTTGKFTMTSEL
jgi:hypothetical protein